MKNQIRLHFSRQFFLMLLFLLCFVDTQAQPPTQPILRIEGGMHATHITRISIDRENRYLVTSSYDKTARVWDLSTGQLLQILRVPIGDGHEGKIYSVAISPDGNTVVVGGWLGYTWFKKSSIYFFDRQTGRLIKRLADLPGLVHSLIFSPDGRFLAAGLDNKAGIRLFETNEYKLIGSDNNYTEIVRAMDFNLYGNLFVTGDRSGILRLYSIEPDGKIRRVAMNQIKGNYPILNTQFSPDGERIAVGFTDAKFSAVVSSNDLGLLFVPDAKEINYGNFAAVAWSADGQKLYGGGNPYNIKRGSVIRTWKNEGRGNYSETSVSTSYIYQILPLQKGSIVYCTTRDWGILNESGEQIRKVEMATADFRGDGKGIYISDDGSNVSYQYITNGVFPARFSLYDRKIELNESKKGLNEPIVKAENFKVTDWKNSKEPKLNDRVIKFYWDESTHSMAVTPDESGFLLGMSNHLRMMTANGKELWRKATEIVWSVNVTKNGKLAVAALGDGTIRWYRISDGQEILAFYPHSDRKRWILWTPSGYYDASPDAEDLIGWHVNNGADQAADFFPNHLFRAQFYRPDIIDQILRSGDEIAAVKISNEKAGRKEKPLTVAEVLPPVIEIADQNVKEISNPTVNISYNIRNHSGEKITTVKALIDGREIEIPQPAKITQSGKAEITLKVPKRSGELSLVAQNRYTKSLPAKIHLKWSGE